MAGSASQRPGDGGESEGISLLAFTARPLVLGSFVGVCLLSFSAYLLSESLLLGSDHLPIVPVAIDVLSRTISWAAALLIGWQLGAPMRQSWVRYGAGAAVLVFLGTVYPILVMQALQGGSAGPVAGMLRAIPTELTTLCVIAAIGHSGRRLLNREQARVGLTRLEARVARTRTLSYHARLRPDFVIQALDAIAERIAAAPDDADRLLLHVSDLLRLTLHRLRHEWISLSSECEFLTVYYAVARGLCHGTGTLTVRVDPAHAGVLVPSASLSVLFDRLQAAQTHSLFDAAILVSSAVVDDHLHVTLSCSVPSDARVLARASRNGDAGAAGATDPHVRFEVRDARGWLEVPLPGDAPGLRGTAAVLPAAEAREPLER